MSFRTFLGEEVVRPELVPNLLGYKYKGENRSLAYKYFSSPVAELVTHKLVPLRLAPNIITLTAFACMLAPALLLVYWFGASFEHEPVPDWFDFLAAAGLWVYMTLDNVDGKQARRTGSSSVLGMIFDHGCDSLIAALVCVVALHIAGGDGAFVYAAVLIIVSGFFLEVVSQKATGVCYLGYINPVDEGLLALVVIFLVSGVVGNQFWRQNIGSSSVTFTQGFMIFVSACSAFFLSQPVWHIARARGLAWTLNALFGYVFHLCCVASLLFLDLTVVWREELYLVFIFVFVAARLINHMMLAHVSDDEPRRLLLVPFLVDCSLLAVFACEKLLGPQFDRELSTAIRTIFWVTLVYFLSFAVSMMRIIAGILGIKIFSIKPQYAATGEPGPAKDAASPSKAELQDADREPKQAGQSKEN